MKYYYSLRVLRLLPCTLCPFVRSSLQCFKRFYLTLAYSTIAGSPVPSISLSVSPGGFIPDAVYTSGNFERMSTLLKQSCALFLFAPLSNYRDLIAASLYVRLLQTHLLHRSPPCCLEQRSIQPVWWWRLLRYSLGEDCSHLIDSFAGKTGVLHWWDEQSIVHFSARFFVVDWSNFQWIPHP